MATIRKALPPALITAIRRRAQQLARIDYLTHRETEMKRARERILAGEDVQIVTAELEAQAQGRML